PLTQDVPMDRLRSVNELSDVQPGDWAYQALKALVEKYEVMTGFPDRTFHGNRPLTRYEFATVMNAVITQIEQYFISGEIGRIREDFATIRRLQDSYDNTLGSIDSRVQKLETEIGTLEQHQFSTTTQLKGELVAGLTDGSNANSTIPMRIRLDLNTSFTGTDLLRTELEAGNNGGDAISKAQSTRGPNLLGTFGLLADGGGLDFVSYPNTVRISKLYYTFAPAKNLNLTVGGRLNPRDFIDYNRFANDSLENFSSSFFMNNPLIVQNPVDRSGGAGAAIAWAFTPSLILKGLYVAADASSPGGGSTQRGLFGDRNQGSVELEYSFNPTLVARLQYTSATVNGVAINAGGLNVEWAFNRQFAAFGRFGIGRYAGFNTVLDQQLSLTPITWALGGTIRNIVIPGSVAGLAIGQPFVTSDLGNATQTNFEAYYRFNLNDSVIFSPAFLIVANPNNRAIDTIFEWVVRMNFSF
ncbi:iron uptake porin, partial [Leptodesmis sp.]|uniref:iron uptake porin n=1 Tax=Leptodesmis sp. TaxID=3100501 RepID=UPI00405354CE